MSFNPYEILSNLRRNSNKEPLKAFDLQKSDNNLSVSYSNAHPYKPQPNFQNEPAKSKDHFSNSNGFPQPQKSEMNSNFTTLSTNRNPLSEMRDKENNNYNPEAAIRLYKNKLVQEMPELVTKDPYEQDHSTSLIHDRSSQNLSLNDLGGHYENKSIEKLQTEFNQLKRDLKTELHNLQSRRDTEPMTREEIRKSSRSQENNKYSRNANPGGLFTFKNQQEFRSSKRMTERGTGPIQQGTGTNKEKITGALKLQPFIYLRENYPEFPQSIIKIDLKELKNI